ncbi:MAG: CHAD domain-containing protein, partial [Ktedonobacteraceae bacterium]|nr:CHAD domain-containing protein [Ktedonobacteraceae bacterium]
CCDPKTFKKVYRGVKETADLLGTARDTDVMLLGWHAQLEQAPAEEQPALRWLIARLSAYREQEQENLEDYFATFDEKTVRRQIDICISKGATTNGKS